MASGKVIVLGGGIAGLSCARQLAAMNIPFVLITKDIGGRIQHRHNINYGAYYITKDYRHVLPLCQSLDRIWPWELAAAINGEQYSLFSHRSFLRMPQVLHYLHHLRKFRAAYRRFHIDCETMDQKTAMECNEHLHSCFNTSAIQWLESLQARQWVDEVIAPLSHASTFLPMHMLTLFDLFQFTLNLLVPSYRFRIDFTQIIEPIQHALVQDEIESVTYADGITHVSTKNTGMFSGSACVLACGEQSFAWAGLLEDRIKAGIPARATMTHIRGTVKNEWRSYSHYLLAPDGPGIVLARQADGTYLYVSKSSAAQLDGYFKSHDVIGAKTWSPAFRLGSRPLFSLEIKTGLFLVGDHNICGLEDSYLSGLYAAKRIHQLIENGRINLDIPSLHTRSA